MSDNKFTVSTNPQHAHQVIQALVSDSLKGLPHTEIEQFFRGMTEPQLVQWMRGFLKVIRERKSVNG